MCNRVAEERERESPSTSDGQLLVIAQTHTRALSALSVFDSVIKTLFLSRHCVILCVCAVCWCVCVRSEEHSKNTLAYTSNRTYGPISKSETN